MLSPSDTAIVFLLALLLFGPDQVPKLARQLGEAMRHVQNTTHTFMQEMERAAEPAAVFEHLDNEGAAQRPLQMDLPAALPTEDVVENDSSASANDLAARIDDAKAREDSKPEQDAKTEPEEGR